MIFKLLFSNAYTDFFLRFLPLVAHSGAADFYAMLIDKRSLNRDLIVVLISSHAAQRDECQGTTLVKQRLNQCVKPNKQKTATVGRVCHGRKGLAIAPVEKNEIHYDFVNFIKH